MPEFLIDAEQVDESTEYALAQLIEPRHMLRRFAMNALGAVSAAKGSDFLSILRHAQPAMDHRLVDFQMKLKAVDIDAVTKSLIGAQRRESEMAGSPGDVKGVPMPLKNSLAILKLRQ